MIRVTLDLRRPDAEALMRFLREHRLFDDVAKAIDVELHRSVPTKIVRRKGDTGPIEAASMSEYRRLRAQGVDVVPPRGR